MPRTSYAPSGEERGMRPPVLPDRRGVGVQRARPFAEGPLEVIRPYAPGDLRTGEGDWRSDIADASWRPPGRRLAGPTAVPGERGL